MPWHGRSQRHGVPFGLRAGCNSFRTVDCRYRRCGRSYQVMGPMYSGGGARPAACDSPHRRRRALGPQCDESPASVFEIVNFLFDYVGGRPTPRSNSSVCSNMGVRISLYPHFSRSPYQALYELPQPGVVRHYVESTPRRNYPHGKHPPAILMARPWAIGYGNGRAQARPHMIPH